MLGIKLDFSHLFVKPYDSFLIHFVNTILIVRVLRNVS
jgi:hypothetical protein